MRRRPANGSAAVRVTCTKPLVEATEAYLRWSRSDAERTYSVSRVREWLALSTSNSDQLASHLQEWLRGVGVARSWKSLDPASQRRCAELFLLEVPGGPCWGRRVGTIQLAAPHLAAEAQAQTDPQLWVGDDFEAHADRIPGLGDLIDKPRFRTRAAKCVAEELGVAEDAPLINAVFGHPKLRRLITRHTDVTLARLANAVLCGLQVAQTDLPRWLFDRLEYTDFERRAAIAELFAKAASGPAHALWANWSEVVEAVESQYLNGAPSQQLLDGSVEESPQVRWMSALLNLRDEVSRRDWLKRNLDRRSGRPDVVTNHCEIVNLVKREVLDATGLPHSKRSTKENARLLKSLLGAPQLTMRDLGASGLRPLRRLVKGALADGGRRYPARSIPTRDVPPAAEVVCRLLEFSRKHGFVPAPSRTDVDLGFTANQIELALGGETYSTYVERLIEKGFLPESMGLGRKSSTAKAGEIVAKAAFGGLSSPEVSLSELLPERVFRTRPRWRLCRVDFVVREVDGHDGRVLLCEFDGEQHFVQVVGKGNLAEHRERDRDRHRQLRLLRKSGVDAYLLSMHWNLLRNTKSVVGAEQVRAAFDAAVAEGFTWIFLRPSGCEDMRAHLGKVRRLDAGLDGVEVFVTH